MQPRYDLIVAGAGPTALSIAAEALRSGLRDVLVLAPGDAVHPSSAVGRYRVPVRFGARVETAADLPGDGALVETETESFPTRIAVVVDEPTLIAPRVEIPAELADRIHDGRPADIDFRDQDVLVVGSGDPVVGIAADAVAAGGRVVVSFTGSADDLSSIARETFVAMEHDRDLTILWRSVLDQIVDADGYPMVYWQDRHTPALQFDHVVGAMSADDAGPGTVQGGVVRVRADAAASDPWGPARAWQTMAERFADRLPRMRPAVVTVPKGRVVEADELRARHYNATITHFDHSHEDLWVIRVRPDRPDATHRAGQYTTLGLGYWEPRVDDADESLDDERRASLIRRSYSISSRVFDDRGYLTDPHETDEIEFYIVHVRPDGGRIPALTPRLAAKRAGDRIYLGSKITGRYTLSPVDDPASDVVFLATGTGEAPHNAMITELVRKGHQGRIVSVVTVRHLRDLGYAATHERLERRFANYRYLVLPTREPDHEKRYIQDFIEAGDLERLLPHALHPGRTHVFLCGNPRMIGVPETGDDGSLAYPDGGVIGMLAERGLEPDRRSEPGVVHYEEYW